MVTNISYMGIVSNLCNGLTPKMQHFAQLLLYIHVANLQSRGKGQFICEANGHLRMLQHVRKADRADGILGSVNELAAVRECRLNHESRRVASLRCRSVIGASVTTLCLHVRDGAVLVAKVRGVLITGDDLSNVGKLTAVMTFLMKPVRPAST